MKIPQWLFIPGLLFLFLSGKTQNQKSQAYLLLTQKVNVSEHQNQPYRLSAALKVEGGNGNENMGFWGDQFAEDGTEGSSEYVLYEKSQKGKWSVINIEGTIDKEATTMAVGVVCQYNGEFYLDAVKLEVKDKAGTWRNIELNNPDFEDAVTDQAAIWNDTKTLNIKEFTTQIVTDNAYQGKHALLIRGENIYGQQDDRGGFIDVNGVSLYYEIYGEGEPLLLLHGAGQSISAFGNQIEFFSPHYQVIAVDSRGRGRSTDTEEDFTYENQALDMNMFLEKLELDSVNIIGWSDGGIIGLIMAIKYPDKINRLVAFGANIHPDGLFPERLASHKKRLAGMIEANNPNFSTYIKIYKALINEPQMSFEDLKAISAPTLIMAGDYDVIQDEHTVDMFQAIPNAHLAIMPGETHWMPSANYELFNATVLHFLTREFEVPERW